VLQCVRHSLLRAKLKKRYGIGLMAGAVAGRPTGRNVIQTRPHLAHHQWSRAGPDSINSTLSGPQRRHGGGVVAVLVSDTKQRLHVWASAVYSVLDMRDGEARVSYSRFLRRRRSGLSSALVGTGEHHLVSRAMPMSLSGSVDRTSTAACMSNQLEPESFGDVIEQGSSFEARHASDRAMNQRERGPSASSARRQI
jgi:hypothetical protein